MKKYKYVLITLNGHSYEIDGRDLNKKYKEKRPTDDLNRLLEDGWHPVREMKTEYLTRTWLRTEHYPFVIVLLEKDVPSPGETGIQTSLTRNAQLPATD